MYAFAYKLHPMILTVKWLCLDFAPFGSRVMTRESGLPDFRRHPSLLKIFLAQAAGRGKPGQ
jgi:hypothetical protein